MIVYVTEQGTVLSKEGKRILVRKDASIYQTLFAFKLTQVVLFGNVAISARARSYLFRNNVMLYSYLGMGCILVKIHLWIAFCL